MIETRPGKYEQQYHVVPVSTDCQPRDLFFWLMGKLGRVWVGAWAGNDVKNK